MMAICPRRSVATSDVTIQMAELKPIRIHPHARERMEERGANEEEVVETVRRGERFPTKFGRIGFCRNFPFDNLGRGNALRNKTGRGLRR